MLLRNIRWMTWLYMLILLLGSVLPLNSGTTLNNTYIVEFRSDYLIHTLIMMPLPALLVLRLRNSTLTWVRVVVLALLIVIFCEAVQMLIPYRTFNINDLFANGIGALLGFIPALFIWRYFQRSV
jgi:glycopeptide antibiotics resistance protein